MNKTRHLSQALATRRIIRAMNRQLLFLFAGAFLLARTCDAQTFTNGSLVWNSDTNISLYVILESPCLQQPRQLWNVIGEVTNVPPTTNAQISFPLGLTNRYPDYVGPQFPEFFTLLEWPGSLPAPYYATNWYVLQYIMKTETDEAGRVVWAGSEGHWFYTTDDVTSIIIPIAQMPGVSNNNPNFNILHF